MARAAHGLTSVLPPSGTEQMLSHGTADVVLEACTDFWDGADIYPLSGSDRWVRKPPHADGRQPWPSACLAHRHGGISGPLPSLLPYSPGRKKVLDFYQRACLSGYCSAFAYKPMSCALSSQLSGKCIELVQAPGQSSIFTTCELPSTVPIKLSTRRSSWSSDGTVRVCPVGGPVGRASGGPWNRSEQREPWARRTWSSGVAFSVWWRGQVRLLLTGHQVLALPSSRAACDTPVRWQRAFFESYKAAVFIDH